MPMPTLSPNPRDLVALAQDYTDNTSLYKKALRSKAFSPIRRAKGAKGSAAANVVAKGIGVAIKKIPVPILNDILGAAWKATIKSLRTRSHKKKLGLPKVSEKDKIKFTLKDLGGEVASWDRYRWKIAHGIEEVNKQTDATKEMKAAPCDLWVKLLAKRMYVLKRIAKLRASVESVQSACEATLIWLSKVEQDMSSNETMMAPLFDKDVQQLKTFAGAHQGCSPEFCMHSTKKWTSGMGVPASSPALYISNKIGQVTAELDVVSSTISTAAK